jgi:hypothetical protein
MGVINKKWILVLGVLSIFPPLSQGKVLCPIDLAEFIYGRWQYQSHAFWKLHKFTEEHVEKIKASTLHIEQNRIYFEGIDFISPGTFTSEEVKIMKLSTSFKNDRELELAHFFSGPLRYEYTPSEFQELYKIELGHPWELTALYLDLDQETIMVNRCGGVCFFMKKLPHAQRSYRGKGSATYTFDVPEHSSFLQLRYWLGHVQAWLTVKDQDGRIVCSTKTGENRGVKTVRLPTAKVSAFTFLLDIVGSETKWKLDAAIY